MEDIRDAKHWLVNPPPPGEIINVLDTEDHRGWRVAYPEEISFRPHKELYWKPLALEVAAEVIPNLPCYWILIVPDYGDIVFFGKEGDAEELRGLWVVRNDSPVSMHKADKKNARDKKLVQDEISAVIADIRAGIKILPLPAEGWV